MSKNTQNVSVAKSEDEKAIDQLIAESQQIASITDRLEATRKASKEAYDAWLESLKPATKVNVKSVVESIKSGEKGTSSLSVPKVVELKSGEFRRIEKDSDAAEVVKDAIKARRDYLASKEGRKVVDATIKDKVCTSMTLSTKGKKSKVALSFEG